MGETNDGIGNDYGKLQGADAPALLAFDVPDDAEEAGYRALARYESHAEALGLPISDVHCGEVIYTPSIERMAEGTVAQMGALLDSFSADEELAYCEGDVLLYLERGFERAKLIEHKTAALDAIRERHHWRNGGILVGILPD